MKIPKDALGREIRPGQFILYAVSGPGHALAVKPALVIRVSENYMPFSKETFNVLSVLVSPNSRVSLRKFDSICCVPASALPQETVQELLACYETRHGASIADINTEERIGKSGEFFIGVS